MHGVLGPFEQVNMGGLTAEQTQCFELVKEPEALRIRSLTPTLVVGWHMRGLLRSTLPVYVLPFVTIGE